MSARPSSRPPARSEIAERQVEALTVAMVVAPGVYVRNRMFDLFKTPAAKRARERASILRGIIPQLARATSVTLGARGDAVILRYVIVDVHLTRVVELSSAELAAVRLVAERASIHTLPPAPTDRELVARALAKLMDGAALEASPFARELIAPPYSGE